MLNLESAIRKAATGREKELQNFYEILLESSLWLPFQKQSFSTSTNIVYPPFFRFLGIDLEEEVFLQSFTRQEYANEWFQAPAVGQLLTFKEILKILPEEWGILINPGQNWEKDITSWEASLLKRGPEGIPEIMEEWQEAFFQSSQTIEIFQGIFEDEKLRLAIVNYAKQNQNINTIRYYRADADDGRTSYILEISLDEDKNIRSKIRSELQNIVDLQTIGDKKIEVVTDLDRFGSLAPHIKPFYTKEKNTGNNC
ncbi:MAG TPA: SseB family protein [Oligoflexia bacterium]|mgnify:CR=1 FL=1|nr:SseB family protein [Oligoflexia bacterium]HMP27401.1 SseB family protein [Oligoflexia bacterium]